MSEELEALRERIDALEDRVASLEGSGASPDGTLDQYDATVLDRIDADGVYGLAELQAAYRAAGIVQTRTLKQRIRRITSMDYFERAGTQSWRFLGRQDDA